MGGMNWEIGIGIYTLLCIKEITNENLTNGKKWKHWQILFSWTSKSLWTVTATMKLKRCLPLRRKVMTNLACVHEKSLQSCLTLCDPMDCSLPGSSVHGILQARVLEWAAMPPSRGPSPPGTTPESLTAALAGGFLHH